MKILKQDNPTLRYVSPRTWVRKTNYLDLDLKASFLAFRKQREDLLILQALPQEGWLLRANVKAATKLRDETILSYAQRLAGHKAGHCEQIDRVLHARFCWASEDDSRKVAKGRMIEPSNVLNAFRLRDTNRQVPSSTYATARKPSSFGSKMKSGCSKGIEAC